MIIIGELGETMLIDWDSWPRASRKIRKKRRLLRRLRFPSGRRSEKLSARPRTCRPSRPGGFPPTKRSDVFSVEELARASHAQVTR